MGVSDVLSKEEQQLRLELRTLGNMLFFHFWKKGGRVKKGGD